jgi:hypothetical protein
MTDCRATPWHRGACGSTSATPATSPPR